MVGKTAGPAIMPVPIKAVMTASAASGVGGIKTTLPGLKTLQLVDAGTVVEQCLLALGGELVEVAVLFDVSLNYQRVDFIARVTIERYGIVDFLENGELLVGQHGPLTSQRTRASDLGS